MPRGLGRARLVPLLLRFAWKTRRPRGRQQLGEDRMKGTSAGVWVGQRRGLTQGWCLSRSSRPGARPPRRRLLSQVGETPPSPQHWHRRAQSRRGLAWPVSACPHL